MPARNCALPIAIRLLVLTGIVVACVGNAGMAVAQSAVRVLVNDEPITSYQIQNRAKMLRAFSGGKQGEKEALEQLIDERLMMQEAKRRNITTSDAEVNEAVARRAADGKLSPEQFEQMFRQAGIDVQTFKDYLRSNMTWSDIVRARFRATVKITDQDVTAALTGKKTEGKERTAYEYMLQQILFVIPPGADKGVEAKRHEQAVQFRRSFQNCDASLQQAGGAPGVVVKPVVRREENQISGGLKAEIEAAPVGTITQPERVDEGFQVVAICAKKEIPGQTQATQELRSELSNERGKLLARRYLRDLRSDAVLEYR